MVARVTDGFHCNGWFPKYCTIAMVIYGCHGNGKFKLQNVGSPSYYL